MPTGLDTNFRREGAVTGRTDKSAYAGRSRHYVEAATARR